MSRQGILIVVSGFSGAGKGTIMKELLTRYEQYALSISATTRAPRPGEQDGREYFFKSKEAFEEMIEKGELIEYACYVDNYYGTPKTYVEEMLKKGRDVILEIEIQGARKIRKQFPDAVLLFVTTKDAKTLRERLEKRGTEEVSVIKQRLKQAVTESEGVEEYDYFVVNDDLTACVSQIHAIIESEHQKTIRNREKIQKIREELKDFSKGE